MSSPLDPVLGPFVLPDARLSSKQKAPRGQETRPSSLFYGKGGTKFPNTVNETLAGKTFRLLTIRARFHRPCYSGEVWTCGWRAMSPATAVLDEGAELFFMFFALFERCAARKSPQKRILIS